MSLTRIKVDMFICADWKIGTPSITVHVNQDYNLVFTSTLSHLWGDHTILSCDSLSTVNISRYPLTPDIIILPITLHPSYNSPTIIHPPSRGVHRLLWRRGREPHSLVLCSTLLCLQGRHHAGGPNTGTCQRHALTLQTFSLTL